MEAKGQAPACLSPPGPSAVGRAAHHCKQLNIVLLRMQQPDSSQISFYVSELLLVTLTTIICQPEQSIQP